MQGEEESRQSHVQGRREAEGGQGQEAGESHGHVADHAGNGGHGVESRGEEGREEEQEVPEGEVGREAADSQEEEGKREKESSQVYGAVKPAVGRPPGVRVAAEGGRGRRWLFPDVLNRLFQRCPGRGRLSSPERFRPGKSPGVPGGPVKKQHVASQGQRKEEEEIEEEIEESEDEFEEEIYEEEGEEE